MIVLRHEDGDIRVMLVRNCGLFTCFIVCDSRSMHIWWTVMWWSRSMIYLLIVILCVEVVIAWWLTPTNPSPRSMHISTLFQWIIDFCNKYVSSSWLMFPWIRRTLTLPPLLASLVRCNFRRYHTPTIYLPQNSHHTYRLWLFHSHFEIYCRATFHRSVYMTRIIIVILLFAWSCSWHHISGKATFIISYMSLLIHCISRYTAGGIHIESYLVLSIEL